MSEFNKYAQRLDAAFKNARSAQAEAIARLESAKNKVNNFDYFQPQRFPGENAAKLKALQADLLDEQQIYKNALGRGWAEFERERNAIREELQAALKEAQTATPEQVDLAAIKLLESGVLTPDEILSLCERYADEGNNAMMRLTAKHARERFDRATEADGEKLATVAYIANNYKDGPVMKAWAALEDASTRFLGYSPLDGHVEPIPNAAAQWEAITSEIIEAF